MSIETAPFRPIRHEDGYPPIEDHALIGDLATAALVALDGSINWLCLPRFDAPALFCGILDKDRGGAFRIQPRGLLESRQRYVEDTGVLVTEMRSHDGLIRVTDSLTFRSGADLSEGLPVGRNELMRSIEVLDGNPVVEVSLEPRHRTNVEPMSGGFSLRSEEHPELELHLSGTRDLDDLRCSFELSKGDHEVVFLRWGRTPHRYQAVDHTRVLESTIASWRRWLEGFRYDGPQETIVRRSALTLKMLDYAASGAIVAAPTSSLPEGIGGVRNWDYRYTWIRDAAFSVYALRRIGFDKEAWAFLAWTLDAVERHGEPKVLYTLDAGMPDPEREDDGLEGYRGSSPVRWGNGAMDQSQHDVYGELLDCAFQWTTGGGKVDENLWRRLEALVEAAREKWTTPDHGIWEIRADGRRFTYSVALCHVALDRGARIARLTGRNGRADEWDREAKRIREDILEGAWCDRRQTLTENLDDPNDAGLDASLLTLPLRRIIRADDPRMVSTTKAVWEHLSAGEDLLYRYHPDESPDGLPGKEGAFLLCSFWLVDNLARQGRVDEAEAMYERLCGRANHVGLLPEQIDPPSGAFLGNFPQAFSHIGVIASGINLKRVRAGEAPTELAGGAKT